MTKPHNEDFLDDLIKLIDNHEIKGDFFLLLTKNEEGKNVIGISESLITIHDFETKKSYTDRYGFPLPKTKPRNTISFDFE